MAAQADALATRIVLDELRAGRIAIALELLEQHLDVSVLAMRSFIRDGTPEDREQVAACLRIVRDYRLRHPRKTEAAIDGADNADALHTHKRVQKILDEKQPNR